MNKIIGFLFKVSIVWCIPLCAAIANGEGTQSYWKTLKQTWKQWWEK